MALHSKHPDWSHDGPPKLPIMVICPQCEGKDDYCQYCFGDFKVAVADAREWRRQNDQKPSDDRTHNNREG